jgi:hypothetical protein
MKKLFLAAIATLSVFALAACTQPEPKDGQYAVLAKCLTAKGVKFYGAFWCPHCQNQKKMFGDDIRYIDYVECDPKGENSKTEECLKAGVERYPSWFFPGQGITPGEQKPEELAVKANCEVPAASAATQATQSTVQTQPTIEAQLQKPVVPQK